MSSLIDKIGRTFNILAAISLFLLMLGTFVDVIGRNLFNHPVPGGTELTEIFLAVSIFLLMPSATLLCEHISVDFIDGCRSRLINFCVRVLAAVLGAGLFGLIGWRIWILAEKSQRYGDTTPALQIPLAIPMMGMSVMCFITAITFILTIWVRRT